ncbi:hypothetical protein UFOVP1636_232 [uncultured Caudovirales phage]|uniref:Uncharacterized protein n=1 Tax=uncultured Caudovirales phage TaxID=2100421 RepID=A0A6J5T2U2_9CAUD|nr:hypothetical protein UFOVP1636_232 [uncultured Caudovirales phage]
MKIKDIIFENGGMAKLHPEHKAPIQNLTTFPDQNPSSGSAYKNYRFGIALAGAPDYPTKADNYIAGDPLLAPYTKEEMDMINAAAAQVGDGSKQTWSSGRSQEVPGVNRVSPTAKIKKNKYGV